MNIASLSTVELHWREDGNPNDVYQMDDLVSDTGQFLDHLSINNCLFVGLFIAGMIGISSPARNYTLSRAQGIFPASKNQPTMRPLLCRFIEETGHE